MTRNAVSETSFVPPPPWWAGWVLRVRVVLLLVCSRSSSTRAVITPW
ncbi:hypothetical protein [Streptomyces sp. NPDC051997]